jgi:hypothetical protein
MNVMVITRGCTLDNPGRKHFVVAPLIAIDEMGEQQRTDARLKDLRQNNIPHNFYLPAFGSMKESYADFLMLAPIHRSFFDPATVAEQVVARLSPSGAASLQRMLSDHFGTRYGFDHEDECAQDGLYSCSNCFHSGMTVKMRKVTAGNVFGQCEQCSEDAMWVRVSS